MSLQSCGAPSHTFAHEAIISSPLCLNTFMALIPQDCGSGKKRTPDPSGDIQEKKKE